MIIIIIGLIIAVAILWFSSKAQDEEIKKLKQQGQWLAYLDLELTKKGIIRNEKNPDWKVSNSN